MRDCAETGVGAQFVQLLSQECESLGCRTTRIRAELRFEGRQACLERRGSLLRVALALHQERDRFDQQILFLADFMVRQIGGHRA